jgi:hypothetical protein
MALAALPWPQILAVVELIAVGLIGAGTVVLWRRSAPAALLVRVKSAENEVGLLRTAIQEISAQAAAWRVAAETVRDEVETLLDRTERKRASAAASASRMNAGAAPMDPARMSRAEQIAWGRKVTGL